MTDARARGNSRLANGLEKALQKCSNLERNLKPDNRAYLENIVRIVKSDTWPVDEQANLLIDAQQTIKMVKLEESEPQETRPKTGFIAQLEASRGIQNTPTTEHTEPETQPTSVFRSKLEAARGRKQDSTIPQPIQRKIESNTNHTLTFIGYSYRNFDRVELWRRQDGTIMTKFPEPRLEPKPLRRITRGCGFAAMLEEAFGEHYG
jgi:hypothetical protein